MTSIPGGGGYVCRLVAGILCLGAALLASPSLAAEVTLRNYYAEGMVFQRGKPFAVMGTAPVGTTVTVTIGSNSANAVADSDGAFRAEVAALPTSLTPYKLTVSAGGSVVKTIKEVYSGDLLLVTGQSNMEANYKEYYTGSGANGNYAGRYGAADLPALVEDGYIRFVKADHVWDADNAWSDLPLRHVTNSWLRASASVMSDGATPDNQHFSYLAQFAAQRMRTANPSVPVGVIDVSWGGIPIKDFVSGGLVNTHILPLVGMNVGGILFYQGESNSAQNLYPYLMISFYMELTGKDFPSMINSFHDKFGTDVPIVWAQIARSSHSNWFFSPIRAAHVMALTSSRIKSLDNLACVSTLDTDKGTEPSMHPLGKDIIGPRMADCLLSMIAGKGPKTGPTPLAATASGATVTVTFSNATGLKTMKPVYTTAATATHYADDTPDADVCEVEIAGTDGVFWPVASAKISGETLVAVASDSLVGTPTQIRYAWQNAPENPNLYNGDSLPAPTFVLDVEGATVNKKPRNILFNSVGRGPCLAPISGNAGATAVLPSLTPYSNLKKVFVEWNRSQTGTGASYKAGSTITIPDANYTTLYAIYRDATAEDTDTGKDDSGSDDGKTDTDGGKTDGGKTDGGDSSDTDKEDEPSGEAGWTYTPGSETSGAVGTITDGQWTLKVTKFDKTTGTIAFGTSAIQAVSDTDVGSGVLDLRGPLVVLDTSTAKKTAVTAVEVGKQSFYSCDDLVEFYCDIVSSLNDGGYCFAQNANLTTLEIGGTAESFPCLIAHGDKLLTVAKFDFPNLRKGGSAVGFNVLGNTTPNPVDIATVATPGVTNIVKGAYGHAKLGGDLVLTNVMAMGEGAFNTAALTNVTLAGTLDTLPSKSFRGSSITNVVLDLPNLATVAADAFSGQTKIRRVELVTRLADMGQLTNVVAAANNTAAKDLVVYVSTNQWKASAAQTCSESNADGFFSALTDAEKTDAPADAFGVLVVKGVRKGIFVHKASATDSEYPVADGGDSDKGDGDSGDGGESGGDSSDKDKEDEPSTTVEWTYTPGTETGGVVGTITDGQWTLKVTKFDTATGTIAFGTSAVKSVAETSGEKAGVLDLRSPLVIRDTTTSEKTTVTAVEIGKSAIVSASLVEFYCDIISAMNDGGYCFAQNANLTTLEIGGSAETLPTLITQGDKALTVAKFNFPNLRKGGGTAGQSILGNASPNPIDIATIATPGITNVVGGAFGHGKLGGDLVLTNIMAIGSGAFNGAVLTNVTLTGSLAALPVTAFKGSAITNVVLDLPKLDSIAATAFTSQANVRRVELVNRLSDMGLVSNVVAAVYNKNLGENCYYVNKAWQPNNLRIYVSKSQWTPSEEETYDADKNPTGFFLGKEMFTDTEKAMIAADPTLAKAFGVLVVKSGANVVRKAFFVHKRSVHDQQSLVIRIR